MRETNISNEILLPNPQLVSLGSNCDKLIDHPRRVRAEKMNHVIEQTYLKKCQIRTRSINRHLPFANQFLCFNGNRYGFLKTLFTCYKEKKIEYILAVNFILYKYEIK